MKQDYFSSQQGFSLIELMISITLSLVLVGAAVQVMLSNQQTFRINDDVSRIQENGRIAMEILVKDLRMAGYHDVFATEKQKPDYFLKECKREKDKPAPCFVGETEQVRSDKILVQFYPKPGATEHSYCAGSIVPQGRLIVNAYSVARNSQGTNSLFCQIYDVTAGQWLSPAAVALVDGIDNIQILYGVDRGRNSSEYDTRFLNWEQLTEDDFKYIHSVRLALLVNEGLNKEATSYYIETKKRGYQVLNETITMTDNHLRRVYSTTVQINNFAMRSK